MSVASVIEVHRVLGREFFANCVDSFVLDHGAGEPVLLMHGVPSSPFLYRKVIDALMDRGMRGVAFDLPGLRLAARPEQFDHSRSGLRRFTVAAVDALELSRFHLVVHDVGGPIGFELASTMPERIRSPTILNSPIWVATTSPPPSASRDPLVRQRLPTRRITKCPASTRSLRTEPMHSAGSSPASQSPPRRRPGGSHTAMTTNHKEEACRSST